MGVEGPTENYPDHELVEKAKDLGDSVFVLAVPGMMDEQRAEADQLIFQCLAGRLGWNVHDMQRANGLEIYISQGAKPGLGGQLMAKKVTKELAAIRGIPSANARGAGIGASSSQRTSCRGIATRISPIIPFSSSSDRRSCTISAELCTMVKPTPGGARLRS